MWDEEVSGRGYKHKLIDFRIIEIEIIEYALRNNIRIYVVECGRGLEGAIKTGPRTHAHMWVKDAGGEGAGGAFLQGRRPT